MTEALIVSAVRTAIGTARKGSLAERIYGSTLISERHRHRYEFNPSYEDRLAENGLIFAGKSPDRKFIEMLELEDHPWFELTELAASDRSAGKSYKEAAIWRQYKPIPERLRK